MLSPPLSPYPRIRIIIKLCSNKCIERIPVIFSQVSTQRPQIAEHESLAQQRV